MNILGVLVAMAAYMVVLYFVIEYFRFHVKASMWFWAAATLTFPLWLLVGNLDGWFRWVKTLSVLIPLTIVGMSRVAVAQGKTGRVWEFLASSKWLWFPYGILFLNIAEATIKDVQLGNYANALAGLILCITIPYAPKYWHYTKDGNGELIAYTTAAWNFLYTSWNLNFVYGEAGSYFAASMSILLIAELYPLIKRRPELYIMARIYTLGFHLLVRAFWDGFPSVMGAQGWFNDTVWRYWGYGNALFAVFFVFWFTWQLHTARADVTFRRGPARAAFLAAHPQFCEPETSPASSAAVTASTQLPDRPPGAAADGDGKDSGSSRSHLQGA